MLKSLKKRLFNNSKPSVSSVRAPEFSKPKYKPEGRPKLGYRVKQDVDGNWIIQIPNYSKRSAKNNLTVHYLTSTDSLGKAREIGKTAAKLVYPNDKKSIDSAFQNHLGGLDVGLLREAMSLVADYVPSAPTNKNKKRKTKPVSVKAEIKTKTKAKSETKTRGGQKSGARVRFSNGMFRVALPQYNLAKVPNGTHLAFSTTQLYSTDNAQDAEQVAARVNSFVYYKDWSMKSTYLKTNGKIDTAKLRKRLGIPASSGVPSYPTLPSKKYELFIGGKNRGMFNSYDDALTASKIVAELQPRANLSIRQS